VNHVSIGGELSFLIEKIRISQPGIDGFHDLTFHIADGNFLHICGKNNIVKLLEDALETYKREEREEHERTLKRAAESDSIF